jgi:hypothetical protein
MSALVTGVIRVIRSLYVPAATDVAQRRKITHCGIRKP